ncbi:FecR family protein [Aquimarina pacifica]|uniref:FecR family protein n=1 Tax=Aquimarina pacifica TaxID=1296415 RepID=UPI0004710325|nr:FecR domain-containing protein [Aquimarina pacifica]
MKKYELDETFIARWVAGELSTEELSEFMASEDYQDFYRINEEAQKFKAPTLDKRASLIRVKEKISFGRKRLLNKKTWVTIAASIVIVFGIVGMLTLTKNYTTISGEKLAVILPDGSKIQLNANSTLSHKRFLWLDNRRVNLQGEAYFEVEKGKDFEVVTDYGKVTVLGTKFNIKTRSKLFELNCFEGAVRFDTFTTEEYHILEKGDQVLISDGELQNQKIKEDLPNWIQGISVFRDRPLQEVLDELSIQYKITVEIGNTDVSRLFTGSFIHDDIEKALKSTLLPMGILYTLSDDKTIVYLQ